MLLTNTSLSLKPSVLSSNTGWKMAIHCLTYKNLLVLSFLHTVVLLVYSTGSGHQASQFNANKQSSPLAFPFQSAWWWHLPFLRYRAVRKLRGGVWGYCPTEYLDQYRWLVWWRIQKRARGITWEGVSEWHHVPKCRKGH